ncbi:hypothetical protein QDA11_gp04 [Microbacterium phage Jayden]|uniref:Uncharacterized protein n=1 Tax=Microbacterium phage Jayden TaxID=2656550 RepID=A0A649VSN3_9CAUD|nr:hypothetical protein QDA11_gp04 [Microbacterium phage Jayden]QGJ95224.1 hypothetical protein PBI_JAYDEN_4 [Microbacterium phage Jayden]
MTYLTSTPASRSALAQSLIHRGFTRYVVQAAEGIYVSDSADSALSLLTEDDSHATLYAASDTGETTKVATWDGTIIDVPRL